MATKTKKIKPIVKNQIAMTAKAKSKISGKSPFGPNKNLHGHAILCVHPDCKNKSGGPRFRYFCSAHRVKGIGFGKVSQILAQKKVQSRRQTKVA